MDEKNNGGSAFPDFKQTGISARDYFAAKALVAVLAQQTDGIAERFPDGNFRHPKDPGLYITTAQWWAEQAYQIADAMLSERAK